MANESLPGEKPGPPPSHGSETHFPWKTIVVAVIAMAIISVIAISRNHPKSPAAGSGSPSGKGGGRGGGFGGPVSAVIGTVEQKDFPIYLDGLGTVQAYNTVTVRSRVDGQLTRLGFQEGQDVKAGDPIAQIDPDPFRTQVAQAEAKKSQDEAQLENARVDLRRNADLLKDKIVSQEVYDTQKALVNQLEAAVKADEAAIDNAKVQLAYTTINAPIEGRTGLRMVDTGNIIRSGDSNGIVVLTQLHPIYVVFTLPEQYLGQIRAHQSGPMTVLAVDRDNTTVLDQGKLDVIDNQIDTTTGTIRFKASFKNADLKLWPGQFVNVRLLLSVRTNGIVVPASVVQRGPDGAYAFVVSDQMKVEMARLQVAQIEQGQALIENGLEPGQRVVVDGQYKLQPGATVQASQAPGAAGSSASGTNAPNAGKSRKGPGKKES